MECVNLSFLIFTRSSAYCSLALSCSESRGIERSPTAMLPRFGHVVGALKNQMPMTESGILFNEPTKLHGKVETINSLVLESKTSLRKIAQHQFVDCIRKVYLFTRIPLSGGTCSRAQSCSVHQQQRILCRRNRLYNFEGHLVSRNTLACANELSRKGSDPRNAGTACSFRQKCSMRCEIVRELTTLSEFKNFAPTAL